MNELSSSVLKIMESSPLGRMSVYVLKKQSGDAGIDLESLTTDQIPTLVTRLREVLPFFLGNDSNAVISKIRKLNGNGGE